MKQACTDFGQGFALKRHSIYSLVYFFRNLLCSFNSSLLMPEQINFAKNSDHNQIHKPKTETIVFGLFPV